MTDQDFADVSTLHNKYESNTDMFRQLDYVRQALVMVNMLPGRVIRIKLTAGGKPVIEIEEFISDLSGFNVWYQDDYKACDFYDCILIAKLKSPTG